VRGEPPHALELKEPVSSEEV